MSENAAIEVQGLTKSYRAVRVLDGIDLRVPAGTVFALLGPNGAGKTTTVRILATLVEPDGGSARVAGHDVVADRHAVRRRISLTGQYAAIDELQTGRENLEMMGRLRRLPRRAARSRAGELLERFDLIDAGDRRVAGYSGGMRRRLDLAAGLVASPEVIFLDEPTTGLDPRARQSMWDVVTGLADAGVTVFLTTQYLDEAERLADTIAVLDRGRIVAEGTARELKQRVGGARLELTMSRRFELRGVARLPRRARPQRRPLDADDRDRDRRERRRRASAARRTRPGRDSGHSVRDPDGKPRRRLPDPDQRPHPRRHARKRARECLNTPSSR